MFVTQLLKHSTRYDLWALFGDKVYDVTNHIHNFPEQALIYVSACGNDATYVFKEFNQRDSPDTYFFKSLIGVIE